MKFTTQQILLEIIAFLFVVLFVYAALTKLFEYDRFVVQVGQSPMLTGVRHFIPWMVIASELILAVMLVFQQTRMLAFFGAFSLMTMFTTYIVIILNYSTFVPCSCGGVLEDLGWNEHLIFNGTFILLALAGIVLHTRNLKIQSTPALT